MNVLSQNAFWIVNKDLAKLVGLDAAMLLSDLVTKKEFFTENKMLIGDGYFFNTAAYIEQDTTLSYHKQKKAIKVLEDYGFLETKLIGVPAKLHFKIFENQILNFLNTGIENFLKLYNKNKPIKNKEKELADKKSAEKNPVAKVEKVKRETDPNFQVLKSEFEIVYKRMTGAVYYWVAKDSVGLNSIIKKIRFNYKNSGIPDPNEEQIRAAFIGIMNRASNDNWIRDNFEISILNSKFNNLLIQKKNGRNTEIDRDKFANVLRQIAGDNEV